jgi:exodeoxyribonuclease VII large subunit
VTEPAQGKSADNPWPVRSVAMMVKDWIDKLGTVWIEGQIAQLNVRPNSGTAYITLRDPAADMSLQITCPRDLVYNAPVKLAEGTQVIMHGRPNFFVGRGSFSLRVNQIRAVGIGELLARIDRLRKLLDAEGLSVAEARWPAVRFALRNTIVQGPSAVAQIVDALRDLDGNPDVDVIVLARGGGSVEDLLPFSDETLCREIAKCTTPVVSAIGHEPDNPLCDLVADMRAATPTDAAKRVVPDAVAEQARVADLRGRSARALRSWVHREQRTLAQLRSRPVLAQPLAALTARAEEIHRARATARRDVTRLLDAEARSVGHLSARLATLGPAATLARGYAVVQVVSGSMAVLRSTGDAPAGTRLRIRVADGAITTVSEGSDEAH